LNEEKGSQGTHEQFATALDARGIQMHHNYQNAVLFFNKSYYSQVFDFEV
jgi:hypothetical protein